MLDIINAGLRGNARAAAQLSRWPSRVAAYFSTQHFEAFVSSKYPEEQEERWESHQLAQLDHTGLVYVCAYRHGLEMLLLRMRQMTICCLLQQLQDHLAQPKMTRALKARWGTGRISTAACCVCYPPRAPLRLHVYI